MLIIPTGGFLLLSLHKVANAIMRTANEATDAAIGTTTVFFFFLHESDAQRFGFPSTLQLVQLTTGRLGFEIPKQ